MLGSKFFFVVCLALLHLQYGTISEPDNAMTRLDGDGEAVDKARRKRSLLPSVSVNKKGSRCPRASQKKGTRVTAGRSRHGLARSADRRSAQVAPGVVGMDTHAVHCQNYW